MKKYIFQEVLTKSREITYHADSFDEAYEKWENGYTPDHTGDWKDGDDNEIFFVDVFPIRENSE